VNGLSQKIGVRKNDFIKRFLSSNAAKSKISGMFSSIVGILRGSVEIARMERHVERLKTERARCLQCRKKIAGRSDKVFCSDRCRSLYNYYKGLYFENTGMLDSDEYYYRESYRPHKPVSDQDPTYRGLFSVFKKRHQPDSIAKYALLYCEANDSSIDVSERELIASVASSYKFNRLQKKQASMRLRLTASC
jgi:hypothetical protein